MKLYRIKENKQTTSIYNKYNKLVNRVILGILFLMSSGFMAFIITTVYLENNIDFFAGFWLVIAVIFFMICLLVLMSQFVPTIIISKTDKSIKHNSISIFKFKLYEIIMFNEIKEIGLGRFTGKYTYEENESLYTDNQYYWLLYVIDNNNNEKILIDWSSTERDKLFNEKADKAFYELFQHLSLTYPDLHFTEHLRYLKNPFPKRGNDGWKYDIGRIK